MIRRSTAIGIFTLLLSVLVHFGGVAFVLPGVPANQPPEGIAEQVTVSDGFEDLVDATSAPIEPELADPPEADVEKPAVPERADVPTSEALVASENPQSVRTPDRGVVKAIEPSISAPVTPETGSPAQTQIKMPSDGTETALSDARIAPPVGATMGVTASRALPVTTSASPPVLTPIAPAPGTTSKSVEPVAPVSDVPAVDVLAALASELETPEQSARLTETDGEANGAEEPSQNASRSLRPKARPETSLSPRLDTVDEAENQSDLSWRPPELIESPLTAYQRNGTNLFAGQRAGVQSGGAGSDGALGPGNSTVTNYAGKVLMHLNRVPPGAVSGKGWAHVFFRIEPNGTLGFVNIIDGGGQPEIEIAAKEHIRKGAPFPLPPGGNSRMLNFIYRIR